MGRQLPYSFLLEKIFEGRGDYVRALLNPRGIPSADIICRKRIRSRDIIELRNYRIFEYKYYQKPVRHILIRFCHFLVNARVPCILLLRILIFIFIQNKRTIRNNFMMNYKSSLISSKLVRMFLDHERIFIYWCVRLYTIILNINLNIKYTFILSKYGYIKCMYLLLNYEKNGSLFQIPIIIYCSYYLPYSHLSTRAQQK